MAFDAGSRAPGPIRDEPIPWWEWATRLLGGGMFVGVYVWWLCVTLAPAFEALAAMLP